MALQLIRQELEMAESALIQEMILAQFAIREKPVQNIMGFPFPASHGPCSLHARLGSVSITLFLHWKRESGLQNALDGAYYQLGVRRCIKGCFFSAERKRRGRAWRPFPE